MFLRYALLCFPLVALPAFGQLANGGFETLNAGGLPVFWQGNQVLLHIWVDENGVFHTDSVEFDGGANYLLNTTEPHTGQHAIELRNGFNHTTGEPIIGSWSASEDTVAYAGFPILTIPSGGRPETLDFFGKVTLAGADQVLARIIVFDPDGFEIGRGQSLIATNTTGYQAFHVPVVYEFTDPAGSMQVRFATAEEGAPATLGTRFLIDDVSVTMDPTGVSELAYTPLHLYPNPADQQLYLRVDNGDPILELALVNAHGQRSSLPVPHNGIVDCSALASGVYVLQARTHAGIAQQRVVVRH